MSNVQIHELGDSDPLTGDEYLVVSQSGVTKRVLTGVLIVSNIVREIDGTYTSRPPVADVPNCLWIGESDATLHADFVAWDPMTGAGDTWQEVPTV